MAVSIVSPVNGAISVVKSDPIRFSVTGVPITDVVVRVRDEIVFSGGSFFDGWKASTVELAQVDQEFIANLVSEWGFNESTDTDAAEDSIGGHDGVIKTNGFVLGDPIPIVGSVYNGMSDTGARDVGAFNQRAFTVPNHTDFRLQTFASEAWVYVGNTVQPVGAVILLKERAASSPPHSWALACIGSASKITALAVLDDSSQHNPTPSLIPTLPVGWHQVGAIFEQAGGQLTVTTIHNGMAVHSAVYPGRTINYSPTTGDIGLGNHPAGPQAFVGRLDNMRYYNVAIPVRWFAGREIPVSSGFLFRVVPDRVLWFRNGETVKVSVTDGSATEWAFTAEQRRFRNSVLRFLPRSMRRTDSEG
jgi:hypothetical protein